MMPTFVFVSIYVCCTQTRIIYIKKFVDVYTNIILNNFIDTNTGRRHPNKDSNPLPLFIPMSKLNLKSFLILSFFL